MSLRVLKPIRVNNGGPDSRIEDGHWRCQLCVMEHLTSYPLSWFLELSCSRHPINRVIGVVVSKHVLKSGDHTDFYRPLGK
jgi:hypothetical protein